MKKSSSRFQDIPQKQPRKKFSITSHTLVCIVHVIAGALMFSAAFPNPVFRFGFAPIAFFALFPISLLIARVSIAGSVGWGALYGGLTYVIFNYWLGTFNPNAFFIVPSIYAAYFVVVFPLFAIAYRAFPRTWFIVQCIIWIAYDYLRTVGFLGYSFGVLGTALSFHPLLIQLADVFGVLIISLFTAFPSFFIAYFVCRYRDTKIPDKTNSEVIDTRRWLLRGGAAMLRAMRQNKWCGVSAAAYAVLIVVVVVYGIAAQRPFINKQSATPTVRMALIQHNKDPWEGGAAAYAQSLEILTTLTNNAMSATAGEKKPDVVVWSETAFVPSIYYHSTYRQNPYYVRLIEQLYNLFERYPDTDFIIGNGERISAAEKRDRKLAADGPDEYNAAHLYRGRERRMVYYKNRLVPFTEAFPDTKLLGWFKNILKKNGARFWLPGTDLTLMHGENAVYATPICFEDGFGLQNARFARRGAQIIVNITNDAWSGVEANAMQHLQSSIMRAVENKRSVVRSTNAGMTAVITPNGRITHMLDSFTRGSIAADVPIYDDVTTLYTRFGDWFAWVATAAAIVLSVCGVGILVARQNRTKKNMV